MSTTHTIEQLSTALDKLVSDEYTWFLSLHDKTYHISISKRTYGEGAIDLTVKGQGDTIAEAVERAMNNFPRSPLDGSQWASDRLAGPVTDGDFTETETK